MAEGRTTTLPGISRARASSRVSNPDIFSDDFALEPFELTNNHQTSISDGAGSHDATSGLPQRLMSQEHQESTAPSFRRSRLSQRNDGVSSTRSASGDRASQLSHSQSITSVSDSGNTASTQHRSLRTISTFGFDRAQSPYNGATGPSQPYGMYPQDIGLSRTASAATASTVRAPERSYSGPRGPTQPYGMYAQNTMAEDDATATSGPVPPVVAGFPGSSHQYQRRLGPDGEEVDDLIGPDGYTEQLPPYSQFPNGVPPKIASGIGSVNRRSPPPPPSLPVGNSQDNLTSSGLRDAAPVNPFDDSSTTLNPPSPLVAPPKEECGHFKEKIRKSRKIVCCGVSCWLCGLISVIFFLAVLLGGIIGGVIAHQRGEVKGKHDALAAQTSTAFPAAATATITQTSPPPDAIAVSIPASNLPTLPTGSFMIALDVPTISTNSCLTDSTQAPAWDCATGAELDINVTMAGPHRPVVSLTYPQSPEAPIRYGAQPPQLSGNADLMIYKDRDASGNGAAYFFWQQYNKTVIVHNGDLSGGLPGSKRSIKRRWYGKEYSHGASRSLLERADTNMDSQWPTDSIAKPTDKPWYCYWPETILEGFIYVQKDADSHEGSSGSTAALTSAANGLPSAASPVPNQRRQAQESLLPYPKIVKIEERRNLHSSVQPYCQQMQILNNNQPGPLVHPGTNDLIQIELIENETLLQHGLSQDQPLPGGIPSNAASPTGNPLGEKRAIDERSASGVGPFCQCAWKSS